MKKIRNIGFYLILVLVLVSVTVTGCSSGGETKEDIGEEIGNIEEVDEQETTSDYPINIMDGFGNEETIEEKPKRIVSLAPHNTEILFALGLGDNLVGVTSFCDYPEEATSKEIIGGFSEFNLEKIIELEPDLVLAYGAGDEEENTVLRQAGIKVLGFMPETIDEVIEDMLTIGKITDMNKEAINFTDAMIESKNEIIDKVQGREKVKVFYEIWHEPLQAAGKGSFMGEIITLAGGKNIAEKDEETNQENEDISQDAYPIFDLEQLIERNPEVYLTSADMPEKTVDSIKERPGYEEIEAIKNDRIYIFEGNEANIVSRPGPRIIEALELVAKSIHPELFE